MACGSRGSVAAMTLAVLLTAGCGTFAPQAAAPATAPPVSSAPVSSAPPAARFPAPPGTEVDPATLWETWKQLNVTCRGTSGPESQAACRQRSAVSERQARLVATIFYDAWKRRDTATMASLTHPDNARTGFRIPADLARYTPTEQAFDCRYDIEATDPFGCYTSVTGSGADLYFSFELDDGRGWLVRSFAPDV